jgi:hypothetical protein
MDQVLEGPLQETFCTSRRVSPGTTVAWRKLTVVLGIRITSIRQQRLRCTVWSAQISTVSYFNQGTEDSVWFKSWRFDVL